MLEDALKNMFPYKEISLKSGDTLQITKCFFFIKEGIVIGTFGNKVPENFECSKNEIFGLRQLLDKNFEIIGRWDVPKETNKSFYLTRIVGIDCDKFVTNQLKQ